MSECDIALIPEASRTLGLMLIDDFVLMSYAATIEAYRAANRLAGRTLYDWFHISVDGLPCAASNGATILADLAVGAPISCNALFVFAGGDPATFDHPPTLAWLRQIAKGGTTLIGISAGPYILVQAGLLANRRATIHWEHRDAFAKRFPTTICEPSLYV